MGILQARVLEWVSVASARGSFWPRDGTLVSYVSCIGRGFFTTSTTWEAHAIQTHVQKQWKNVVKTSIFIHVKYNLKMPYIFNY